MSRHQACINRLEPTLGRPGASGLSLGIRHLAPVRIQIRLLGRRGQPFLKRRIGHMLETLGRRVQVVRRQRQVLVQEAQ